MVVDGGTPGPHAARVEDQQARARLLWCFLLEQALMIGATRKADEPKWQAIHEYLAHMLRQGPDCEGILMFAKTAQGLADELGRGETQWERLLEALDDVREPGLHVVSEEPDG